MFVAICSNHQAGFQMTLENGWIVSIMFGLGNYASNRFEWEDDSLDWNDKLKHAEARGRSAELWAFHSTYDMDTEHLHETKEEADNYRLSNHYPEEPIGWQSTSDTLKFINHVSNLPLPSLRIMGFEARKEYIIVEEDEEKAAKRRDAEILGTIKAACNILEKKEETGQ